MCLKKTVITLIIGVLSISSLQASEPFCGDLLDEKPAGTYITEQKFHKYQKKSIKTMQLEKMPPLTNPHIYRCRHSSNDFSPVIFLGTHHAIPLSFFSNNARKELIQADELYVEDARPLKIFYSKEEPLPWSKELSPPLLKRGKAVLKALGYDKDLISYLEIQSLINILSRETYFWGMDAELVKTYSTSGTPIYSLDRDIDRKNEFTDFLNDMRTSIEENIHQLKQAVQSEQLKESIKKLEQRVENSYINPEIFLLKELCFPLDTNDYYLSMKSFHELYWQGFLPAENEDEKFYQMSSRNERWLDILRNSISMKPLTKKLYAFGFYHLRDILSQLKGILGNLYKEDDIIIEKMKDDGSFEPFS